jgi:hypothetical protein
MGEADCCGEWIEDGTELVREGGKEEDGKEEDGDATAGRDGATASSGNWEVDAPGKYPSGAGTWN